MRNKILSLLKKGCSIILALSALIPTRSIYAEEKNDKILFAENLDRGVVNSTDAFEESDVAVSSKVFVNNDFNNCNSLFEGLDEKALGNVLEYAVESNGNGYLFFERIVDKAETFIDAIFDADATMKGLVLSADFSTMSKTPTARIFSARNGYSDWCHILSLSGGNIWAANGTLVATLEKNEWVNVALVLDFMERTYDVYCDEEMVVEDALFPNLGFEKLTSVRTQMSPTVGTETLMIDNMKMYESDVPKDISGEQVTLDLRDIFPKEEEYMLELYGTVALNIGSDWIFAKTEKKKMNAVPYMYNDIIMIPIMVVGKAFGLEVEWDEKDKLITIDGRIQVKHGEKTMSIGDKTIELDIAPEIKDGVTYIPLRALAEQALGKKVFYSDYGLIIISDEEFDYVYSDAEIRRLSTYVFSERPDKVAIKQAFENSGYKNVHPRLHADADDFARFREQSKTNERIRVWTENVINLADNVLNQPPLEYKPDGGRILLTSRAVIDRCLNLGYAYQITGEEKYAKRVWEELESACSFPDWCPNTFLDTAEMAYGVAIGYDWCYDYLTEEQRSFVEEGILKLGLREGIKQYNGFPEGVNFVFRDMNWNAVCNGGLSVAALAIMDVKPEEAAYTINKALRSFEYMITEFAPDGGWVEGPMYWGYTMQYFCLWMDCMNSVLGTDFNVPNYPGISLTGNYAFALQGNEGSNNFNDAGEGDCLSPQVLWLGRYFKNDDLTAAYLSYMDLKNKAGTVYDILYYDTSVTSSEINLPLDSVTRDVEFGAMRSNYDTLDGTYLSYRGGKTGVNHYHVSQGAFVFDALGVRWAMDPGGDQITYSESINGARNNVYRIRPEGHNCLIINPSDALGQSMDANCPIIKSESKQKGAYQVLDLSSAYTGQVSEYLRGYMLTDDRNTAVIRDEFTLTEESEMYWFMHTRADIKIVSDDTAILTRNGKRMQFKMIVEGADAELTVMPAEPLPTSPVFPGQTPNRGVSKIAIHMRGNGKVSVSVRMTPADLYNAYKAFVCNEIANWSIPDGELLKGIIGFYWDMDSITKPDRVVFYGDLADVEDPYSDDVFNDSAKGLSLEIKSGINPTMNIGNPLSDVGGGETVIYSFDLGIDKFSASKDKNPSYFFQMLVNNDYINGRAVGMSIDDEGRINFFGQDTGKKLDAGKWHSFKYLLDSNDEQSKLYMSLCVDGEWICSCDFDVPDADASSGYNIDFTRFCNNSSESTLYVDNICMEKQVPGIVGDNITSESLLIDGSLIHGYKGMNASQLRSALTVAGDAVVSAIRTADGAIVADDAELAEGMTITVEEGASMRSYTLGEADSTYEVKCYFKAAGEETETEITDGKYSNGTVRARVDVTVNRPKNPVVIVAALYDTVNNSFVKAAVSDEVVLTEDGYVEAKLNVEDAANTQMKIMVLDSFGNLSSCMGTISLTAYDLASSEG